VTGGDYLAKPPAETLPIASIPPAAVQPPEKREGGGDVLPCLVPGRL